MRPSALATVVACLLAGALASEARAADAGASTTGAVTLHLRSDIPGLTYFVRADERARWAPLCPGPCSVELPPGQPRLGASFKGGPILAAPAVPLIDGDRLLAHYRSRQGWRTAGIITLVTAIVIGGYVMADSKQVCTSSLPRIPDTPCNDTQYPHALLGLAIGAAGALVSLPMLLQRDNVTFVPDQDQ